MIIKEPLAATAISVPGSGPIPPEVVSAIDDIWRRLALDPQSPVNVTTSQIVAGNIEIDITGDGRTNSTATRRA